MATLVDTAAALDLNKDDPAEPGRQRLRDKAPPATKAKGEEEDSHGATRHRKQRPGPLRHPINRRKTLSSRGNCRPLRRLSHPQPDGLRFLFQARYD